MIDELLDALSRPEAYPDPVAAVEVRQTHISLVFLAGAYVYKVKKPVQLGFLDFSTLEKRRHFCLEELRLNRRLAPHVYLGVVPICKSGRGLQFGGEGEPVEWAVKMVRLPDEATLESRLARNEILPTQIEALARRLASFHKQADGGPHIAEFGRFAVVGRNLCENFIISEPQVGVTVSANVFQRFRDLTEQELERRRELIDDRARRLVPRDTHGDLHLDHMYFFPERQPPDDLVIIDCIEFNERFRCTDPVADMAFVVMDLAYHGRRDLGKLLARTYLGADHEAEALLPLYVSYRAAVRAKVEGLKLLETEVPPAEKDQAKMGAQAHWLLGLWELDEPARRSALIVVCGLPGTGKSTLVAALASRYEAVLLRSDVIRKELAGTAATDDQEQCLACGIYSPEWTRRTYAEMLRRAQEALLLGRRVIVDANCRREEQRRMFLNATNDLRLPCLFLVCQSDAKIVRRRLQLRKGDASDADWKVYEHVAATWEDFTPTTREICRQIDCNGSPEQALAAAIDILTTFKLENNR